MRPVFNGWCRQPIQKRIRRLQSALVARGFVTTRIVSGPQDIKTGVLRLTVIPGKIGNVRLEESTSPGVTVWNALPAYAGDILNVRAIEQGLENFKRLTTAAAEIQIVPSPTQKAGVGQIDVGPHPGGGDNVYR